MFWLLACEACRILAPQPGTEPTIPALEGKVITTGPPGKSLDQLDFELRTPDLKKQRQEEAFLVVAAAASVQSIKVEQCWPHQADVAARFSLSVILTHLGSVFLQLLNNSMSIVGIISVNAFSTRSS